jgi:hypothetical protein
VQGRDGTGGRSPSLPELSGEAAGRGMTAPNLLSTLPLMIPAIGGRGPLSQVVSLATGVKCNRWNANCRHSQQSLTTEVKRPLNNARAEIGRALGAGVDGPGGETPLDRTEKRRHDGRGGNSGLYF